MEKTTIKTYVPQAFQLLVCVASLLCLLVHLPCASAGNAGTIPQSTPMVRDDWPRTIGEGDTQFTIYQPQVESWIGDRLTTRMAIAVQEKGAAAPQYGVAWFSARTEVDKKTRMVLLQDFTITKTKFPKATEKSRQYADALRTALPRQPVQIALDRLQAELEITEAGGTTKAVAVGNAPPRIIFSTEPSMLVLVDGTPVLHEMKHAECMRVINTGILLCARKSGTPYYLWLSDRWVQAPSLEGPWSVDKNPPTEISAAKQELSADTKVDLLEKLPPDVKQVLAQGRLPAIFISTKPAYLLQTQGDPSLKDIAGTRLRYVCNSRDDIIFDINGRRFYVLISGRWFRSSTLGGPWEFVSGTDLPHDFASIPPDSPIARVLTSVPGTPQAKQAVVAANTPQTATVKRSASASVTYDGEPKFIPIDGTPLQQAVNASAPVIRIDAATYYMVDKGVWYTATSPGGPWVVAAMVPQVIYTIPPSSPLHYVTYVHVYGSTPDVVYTGYTEGYYGALITPANTVVYGTGYAYPGWAGSVWYPAPAAYYYGGYDDYVHYHTTYDGKFIERGYAGDTKFTQIGDTTFARNDGDLYAAKDGNLYQRQLGGWKQYDPDSGDWELTNYSKAKDIKKIHDKRQVPAQLPADQQSSKNARTDQTSGNGQGRLNNNNGEGGRDNSRELEDSFRSRAEGERRVSDFRSGGGLGGRGTGGGGLGSGRFGGGGFGRGRR